MIRTRITQAVAGVALATLGATGLATIASGPAAATEESESHEVMHRMMEAVHGDEAVERMHAVDGAEEMMEQCGSMMDAMGGMSGMMRGGGMSGMMGR